MVAAARVDALARLIMSGQSRRRSTLPADLPPTDGYLLANNDELGIDARLAEQWSWRANAAVRFELRPGFVVVGVAPPSPSDPRAMLIYAHDRRDGTGSRLHGAWWVVPGVDTDPVAAFSRLVLTYGLPLTAGPETSLFFLHSPHQEAPRPAARPWDIEVHGHRQHDQFGVTLGWAWCFAVDRRRYRVQTARPR